MQPTNIVQIIALAQAGDQRAYNELTRQAGKIAYKIINKYGLYHEADDLKQTVIVRVCSHLSKIKASTFSQWVSFITVNICKNRIRDKRRESFVCSLETLKVPGLDGDELPIEEPDLAEYANPLAMLEKYERMRQVHQALHTLKPEFREATELYYIEDLTFDQLAERLGTTWAIAQSRVQRSKKKLKVALLNIYSK